MYKERPAQVEEMLSGGPFIKYVNNDGKVVYPDKTTELCQKAESLSHYSYNN